MAQISSRRRECRGKGYNWNFGGEVELNLLIGTNHDASLNQMNESEELSRQSSTLIVKLQLLQLSTNVSPRMLKFNLRILLIL